MNSRDFSRIAAISNIRITSGEGAGEGAEIFMEDTYTGLLRPATQDQLQNMKEEGAVLVRSNWILK